MPYKFISIESIKSASQRGLAEQWDRLTSDRTFPPFTDFTADPDIHQPNQLVVWNVEGEGGQRKFRALYQGENVAEVFNSTWAGQTMDQVVPMSLRKVTLEAAHECVTSGCLVYTIVATIDMNGNQVNCERLLLPFGSDGKKVEQVLGSLQLKGVAAGAGRKKILTNFQMQADVIFSGIVKSGFTATKPPAASAKASAAGEESRRAARRNVSRAGRISFAREQLTCSVRNISATGAALHGANLAGIPDKFTLVLEMESAARLCAVVWRKHQQVGVRFDQ